MKPRITVASGFLLATLLGAASSEATSSVGVNAQAAVTARGGNERGFDLNGMNRGDNPYSSAQLLVLTRAQVDERTEIYLEIPIDTGARSSAFLTYFRPLIRLRSLGDRPWLNLQAGKLPTVFGTYAERGQSTGSALISRPLMFYYRTAVRGDLVVPGPDHFFRSDVGGRDRISENGLTSFGGLPVIYDACWDTGAELYGAASGLQYAAAITQGTISRPAATGQNYNGGYQVQGRVGYQVSSGALFGLRAGASGAVGPYLDESLAGNPDFPAGAAPGDFLNTAWGADLSFARGPWQFFAEGARVGYEVPNVDPTLWATSVYAETVRQLGPQWSVAARAERLDFNRITSSTGARAGWDADLRRYELGVNYRFRPQARLRVSYQATRSPDRDDRNGDLVGVQLQVWTR